MSTSINNNIPDLISDTPIIVEFIQSKDGTWPDDSHTGQSNNDSSLTLNEILSKDDNLVRQICEDENASPVCVDKSSNKCFFPTLESSVVAFEDVLDNSPTNLNFIADYQVPLDLTSSSHSSKDDYNFQSIEERSKRDDPKLNSDTTNGATEKTTHANAIHPNSTLNISTELRKTLKIPEFTSKKKHNYEVTVNTVDHVLKVLKKKEDTKLMKEKQILQNKKKKAENKAKKEKELSISRSFQERKKKLKGQRSEVNSSMQNLRKKIKEEKSFDIKASHQQNFDKLRFDLQRIDQELEALEVEVLQSKIKIKQEKFE